MPRRIRLLLLALFVGVSWVPSARAEKIADPAEREAHLAHLHEVLNAEPGDIAACLDFAQNAGLEHDHAAALAALDRASAVHPGNPELVAQQARQLIAMRRTAQAVSLCQRHLADHPDHAEVEIVMLLGLSRLPGDLEAATQRVFALMADGHDANPDLHETAARLYARSNDFEAAARAFSTCLEIDPLRLMTLYDAAALEMSRTYRPDRALVYLLQFAEIQPTMGPWPMIGDVCLMLGELDQAAHAYATAVELGQNRDVARAHLANLHVARFEFDHAVELFSAGLADRPNDIELLLNRSNAYFRLDETELALADLGRIIEQAPRDPRAYHNRAIFYASQGRFEEAVADTDAVIRLNRRDRAMRELRPQLVEAQQDADVARRVSAMLSPYEPGYHAAMHASGGEFIRNNYPLAAAHATVALAHAEESWQRADALYQRATVHSVLGWVELSIAGYEAALSHEPEHMDALLGLIDLLASMPDRLADAERYVAKVLELEPEHIGARMALVTVLIESERFEEAEEVLESLPMDDELTVEVLSMWSLLFERQGFYGQAADSMAHLDEVDGLTVPGLLHWLDLLKRAGRYAEAEAVAIRVTRLSPRDTNAWVQLGYLRVILGDFEGAREALVRSEDLEPHAFITLRSWSAAMLLAATEGIDGAMPHIENLQRDNPHHFNVDQAVMWSLLFEGRAEEALAYADRWQQQALPQYTATGDDIPLRYMALLAMGQDERAQAVLTDPTLDERAGRPAVRAWIRLQEPAPGDYLPGEVFDEAQAAQVDQMLPFFLAMEAARAGEREVFLAHVAELQAQQFEARYANLHLIIAYIVRERLAEEGE
ncbi:MAG: tetratricopeptide repeat protein [Planctomycetota bacterium]